MIRILNGLNTLVSIRMKLINNNQHWLAFSRIFTEPDIDIIYAVLYHIKQLKGLKKMMKDRNETEINNLMDFIIDNFVIVELRAIFIELLVIITSMHESMILGSGEIKEKINYIYDLLEKECEFQAQALALTGYVECALLDHQ